MLYATVRARSSRYEGTVEDITARRAAEEALHRAHEELEGPRP